MAVQFYGMYCVSANRLFCRLWNWFISMNIFFEKHSTNTDNHTRTSTHLYEHTHAHPTPMSTSERLNRLDLEIHEVGHQERLAVDGDVVSR
jgi:hypothetical protein